MALLQSKLDTELQNLVPTLDATAAKTTLAQAFGDYMKDGTANAVPVIATFVDATCVPAMAAAMSFPVPGTASGAASTLTAGIVAFWAAAVAAPASFIAGATVITPPPYTGLSAALAATFTSNVGKTLAQAAAALAADIDPLTVSAGSATFGVPSFPIL